MSVLRATFKGTSRVSTRATKITSRFMSFTAPGKTAAAYEDPEAVYSSVQNYYGKVLGTSKDLLTTACTTGSAPPQLIKDTLKLVPQEIKDKYYGCGTPLPMGIDGLSVLDLGSGSGQDCYLAASLVGPKGSVTGVDMTDEQLEVANRHVEAYTTGTLGYPEANLSFKKGYIEFLDKAGVLPGSMDMVISNCVINLSPNKPQVLQGVYDALKDGGELHFSDVYVDRRLSEEVRNHDTLLGECLGGALYIEDFKRICHQVGFSDPRQLSIAPIAVTDPGLQQLLGEARFYSITYRCFKLPELESLCEDFGQVAYYKGTIPTHQSTYALDDHHIFETGRPMLVCGNTAAMVGNSWLAPHFDVVGDTSTHFGLFDCSSPVAPTASDGAAGGACC